MLLEELRTIKKPFIEAMAAECGLYELRIFGSVARGEERPDSDVDFLVKTGDEVSLLDLVHFELEVGEILGRPVQAIPDDGLSPFLKDRIINEAVPL